MKWALMIVAAIGCRAQAATDESNSSESDEPPLAETDLGQTSAWTPWPVAPDGCEVEVRADQSRLDWQPCPKSFGFDQCERLDAPWAAQSGWGFGGLLSVQHIGETTHLALSRSIEKNVWESTLYEDDQALASWRTQIPASRCVLGGPYIGASGESSLVAIRLGQETAPTVFLGNSSELLQGSSRFDFGPKLGSPVMPRDVVTATADRIILWERAGRFAVRERRSGKTKRPRPQDERFDYLQNPIEVGGRIYYWLWRGGRNSIWTSGEDGSEHAVLDDEVVSMDALAGDGERLVWTQSTGFIREGAYSSVELWISDRITTGGSVHGRLLVKLPGGDVPVLSVADGWVLARMSSQEVRAIRIADGKDVVLVAPPGLSWSKAATANGTAYLATALAGRPGNDIRFITRVALR